MWAMPAMLRAAVVSARPPVAVPFMRKGSNILTDVDDYLLAKIITKKGERLLAAAGWETEADDALSDRIETMKAAAEAKITSRVSTDQLKDKNTTDLFEASFWEDVAFACINCGTCTYVCPTCWCFDIQVKPMDFPASACATGTAACIRSSPITAPAITPGIQRRRESANGLCTS